jgi:hypothetical protein
MSLADAADQARDGPSHHHGCDFPLNAILDAPAGDRSRFGDGIYVTCLGATRDAGIENICICSLPGKLLSVDTSIVVFESFTTINTTFD